MPPSRMTAASRAADPRSLSNNAASWWFRDPGLLKLAIPIAVGFACTISSGYDGSLMTGLQANAGFMEALDHPDANKLGIIVSSMSLGGIPALMPASWVADNLGRRMGITIGCLVIIAGALVQSLTTGGYKMLAGRFIVGFGGAFCTVSGGPYAIEVAHPRNRPQTAALINTCWYVGSIIAAWTAFGALNIKGSWSWRLVCLIQVIPPALQLFAVPFIPESPRFLVAKGRVDDAHKMLAKYHANGDMDDELVLFELEEIKEAIHLERTATEGVTYASFLKTKGNRHRLAIIIMVSFFSQWVGNGIISYYLVKILDSVGITSSTQQTGYNGGLQIFNWLMAIAGSLSCERFGRRKLWLTSAVGMLFSFIVITACSATYAEKHVKPAGTAVLAFLFIYFGFYDIAFTGLSTAYPLEVLPFSLRTKGVAIQGFCISCALFFNSYVNPIALDAIAWKYYFVYIGVLVLAIFCIYNFYPETKNLHLEEVAAIFDGEAAVLPIQRHEGAVDELHDTDSKGHASHTEVVPAASYGSDSKV